MKLFRYNYKTWAKYIIATLVLCSAFLFYRSTNLSRKLNLARLDKESLLSENIHLTRSLEQLQKELNSIKKH